MFEHLGPTPEVSINKPATNYKLYLSFLFMSIFVFMFVIGVNKGPSSQARVAEALIAEVLVDPSDKQIVATSKNFSVFDFIVDIDKANSSLYKLNILVEGVYDLDLISDLKLFHEGVQLGAIDSIDNQGKIYFNLADYKLKEGQNTFSLFFSNVDSLKNGQVLKFSIPNKEDISLISKGHVFRPRTEFPVSGGLITIIDKGQVMASNTDMVNDFLIISDVPQQMASFDLSSIGEKLDLKQVTLSYQDLNFKDYSVLDFVLIHKNKIISQAVASDGDIIFDLSEGIVLQDLVREKFYLYSMAMPIGSYQFFIKDIQTQGALSGLNVSLNDSVALNTVEAKPYFILLSTGYLNSQLSEGWNQLYSLNIKTVGEAPTYLNKITWQIDKQNLDIDAIEIWKDGEPYIANIVLKDDKLIIKTDGLNPLKIGQDYTKLLILANLVNVKPKAKIQTFILTDEEVADEEIMTGNILWSDGDNFYNGYKIPYLPLKPSILSN